MLAVRDALKLKTKIVGVVSAHASSYAKSFTSRRPVESPVNTKIVLIAHAFFTFLYQRKKPCLKFDLLRCRFSVYI